MSYKTISLFSGCGGMDVGLHSVGFHPLACFEIDKHASQSLSARLHKVGVSCRLYSDVSSENPEDLRENLGLQKGELDLLVGGPPCQSFSAMGKRGSLSDARGLLLFEMIRYAAAFQPRAILIEQVRGLLNAPDLDGVPGAVFKRLLTEISDLGYFVNYKLLCAADYGVPQMRYRLFTVALKDKIFVFPNPTHQSARPDKKQLSMDDLPAYRTLKDVISDLPEPVLKGETESTPNHVDPTPNRDRERISCVRMGKWLGGETDAPDDLRCGLKSRDSTKYRRLSWNEPSLTLRCGQEFYHPEHNRYLTPREYLRIHGFPDDYVLYGPIRGRTGTARDLDQHRQVANSVPPPLAEAIGRAIRVQGLDG